MPDVVSSAIEALRPADSDYPKALTALDRPPDPLYGIGNFHIAHKPLIAIVGTRDPTAYGLRTTRSLATALTRAGLGIVSGMARGIDAAAHRASLESGGSTVAVLGTGIDVPYPAAHRELHRVIGAKGLVISENPPGATAQKGAFPKRNRIIAALGRFTLVVEAGHRSGALNTARHAMDLGMIVAAVPGPIDSPQSDGTNQLIRDGAVVIASTADALTLAGMASIPQEEPIQLDGADASVWSALGCETLSVDTIAARTRLPTRECLTAITSLEIAGLIESLITGEVRRR
ncbi:MAG: DNA-processing protein DprA [Gemmatimonadaceae bacterium]